MKRRRRATRRRWLEAANKVAAENLLPITSEAAGLDLTAAAGDDESRVRSFKMTAYTGGAMRVDLYHWPVVVDLAGMEVATQSRPILKQHDPEQIVGHTESIKVAASSIKLAGKISGIGEAAEEVVRTADNGFPWQSSIGAAVQQLEFVDRGNSVKVNGRKFTGPLYVARKTSLKETSFVALGGDDNSTASIAAGHSEGNTMGFEAWLTAKGFTAEDLTDGQRASLLAAYNAEQTIQAAAGTPTPTGAGTGAPATVPAPPIAAATGASMTPEDITAAIETATRRATEAATAAAHAEATRVSDIRRLCAAQPGVEIQVDGAEVALEAHAIANREFDAQRVELELLRAARPSGPGIHIADCGRPGNEVIEAALCRTGGLRRETIEADYGDQTLSACDRHYRRGISLHEMVLEAAYAGGYTERAYRLHDGNLRDVLRAAFTTADLSGILSNSQNKFLLESFNFVEDVWRRVAGIGQVGDFKKTTRYRLIGDAEFEEVGADGKLAHGTVGEDNFTAQADTHGKIFSLTRKMLRDDDLDALVKMTRRIGRGSHLKLNKVFWTTFLDDSSFFTTQNKNLLQGVNTLLSSSALQLLETAFLEQVDHEGNPLGMAPAILLTPITLGVEARELYQSTNTTTGGSSTKSKQPSKNIWEGRYRPEQSAYLNNATIPGGSATASWLLGEPLDCPIIEVSFLDGVEVPTVESAEADFDELGIQMRGLFDFGVDRQEHRGAVKATGVAA